jgi:hypothetical protein
VRPVRLFVAAALAAALAGCATTSAPPRRVATDQQCASGLASLPAHALAVLPEQDARKLKARDFADVAQCVELADGTRVPAALFRLDDVPVPALVKVVLNATPHGVLAAGVTLLDAQFQEQSRVGFDAFSNRGTQYTADVFVNAPAVRYVLVSPDRGNVGKSESVLDARHSAAVIPAGVGVWVYHSGSEARLDRAFTDAGSLLVTVKPATSVPVHPPQKP